MGKEHANNIVIARGSVVAMNPEETQENPVPQIAELYLDKDAKYRWYEEGVETQAAGATLRTAIESARLKWPGFEIVELRGRVVEWQNESQFPETYAADELEEKKALKKTHGV